MSHAMDAMPGFTFGCDPELFVACGDELVSADGLIPGTKAEPYKVPGGAVQVDGMAAEFNIDPVNNFQDFNTNISKVMKTLTKMLPPDHRLVCVPSVTFSKKVWETTSEHSKELGCTPDFNAWTGEVNTPPEDLEHPRLRTASGHIHIGWTDDASLSDVQHIMNCRDLVKQLDWYLGGWSLKKDQDSDRRRLYGKAGACRYKPYGVEYRVLSNFWLSSTTTRREVWDRMQAAIWGMRDKFIPEIGERYQFNNKLIQSINTCERDKTLENEFKFPLNTTDSAYFKKRPMAKFS